MCRRANPTPPGSDHASLNSLAADTALYGRQGDIAHVCSSGWRVPTPRHHAAPPRGEQIQHGPTPRQRDDHGVPDAPGQSPSPTPKGTIVPSVGTLLRHSAPVALLKLLKMAIDPLPRYPVRPRRERAPVVGREPASTDSGRCAPTPRTTRFRPNVQCTLAILRQRVPYVRRPPGHDGPTARQARAIVHVRHASLPAPRRKGPTSESPALPQGEHRLDHSATRRATPVRPSTAFSTSKPTSRWRSSSPTTRRPMPPRHP